MTAHREVPMAIDTNRDAALCRDVRAKPPGDGTAATARRRNAAGTPDRARRRYRGRGWSPVRPARSRPLANAHLTTTHRSGPPGANERRAADRQAKTVA